MLLQPLVFRTALCVRLPMAALSGLKIASLDDDVCTVAVDTGWRNRNPFGSTYWAVQGMAAEMASGAAVFQYINRQTPRIGMLVRHCDSTFHKAGRGPLLFVCRNGDQIRDAVLKTQETGEAALLRCLSEGFDEQGERISSFHVDWSLKRLQ